MKKLLLSTAILGAAAVPALAQDQTIFREAPDAMELRASDFMGMRVYATEAAVEGEEIEGIQEGWEDIGEINDVVMDRDGQVQAVLVDIGGFLGIGERTVAVSMDALEFVSDSATAEQADDFFLVMNANREALEAAPEYMDTQTEGMTAEQAATETEQAIEEGGENVAAAGAVAGAAAGAAVGTAVEGAENAGEEVATTTVEVTEGAEETVEATGETVADATGEAAEGAENVVEETGEELADAGQEVTDEVADAGEEVSEEVAQTDMTDTQEDQAEVADASQDATEEATEETAQAQAEATDENADQAEVVAEGTETEMEADQTAAAATEPATGDQVAATDDAATTVTTEGETATAEATETEATTEETTTEVAEGETATAVTETEQTSAETVGRTPVEREGFVVAGAEDLTADRLEGAAVFDANDQRVGEVGEIILSAEGQVEQLVIDVGGFLGIGEKPVALEMASLDILRQDGGEEVRVYVSQTEEELEGMERYEAQ